MSPGLVSYEFEPVNCTVAKSYYNGSVPCHVTNILHRGCTSQMNCLEIIVETSPNYGECKFWGEGWKLVLTSYFRWLLSASTERVQFCYGCFELQLSSKRVHMRCDHHKSSCWISQDLVRNCWFDVPMFPKQKRSETSRLIKIDTNISNDPCCDLARFRNVSK